MLQEEKDNTENKKGGLRKEIIKAWWQPALILFLKFSSWLIIPIIAAFLIGRPIDKAFGTDPFFFLIVFIVSFILAIIGLARQAKKEFDKIEENEKKKE